MSTIYTLGFTRKTAEEFFALLQGAGVACLIDIRLRNRSQLAGFAKQDDLAWFAREACRHRVRPCPRPRAHAGASRRIQEARWILGGL